MSVIGLVGESVVSPNRLKTQAKNMGDFGPKGKIRFVSEWWHYVACHLNYEMSTAMLRILVCHPSTAFSGEALVSTGYHSFLL